MKTWILKHDLSRTPQAAFRVYACDYKKPRIDRWRTIFDHRPRPHIFIRKLESQLKKLADSSIRDATIFVKKIS